jgi:DNA polymerase bacteriophage-type
MISLDPAQRAHHDFEGASALDIKKVGAYRWMTHPSCQCWMMSWRIGPTGPISRWHPGDVDPVPLLDHVQRGGTMVAHNAAFERDFWNLVVRKKYAPHWPELRIEQQDCTLARASTLALPAGLDFVTKVLGTDAHKDSDGTKLMIKMARPRNRWQCTACAGAGLERICGRDNDEIVENCSVCGGSGEIYEWWNTPENIARLGIYCDADLEAETGADLKVLNHTERERRVWEMDQRINSRGVKLDRPLIERMIEVVVFAKAQMDKQMSDLTYGFVKTCGQVAKIVEWINLAGVPCTSVAKGEQAELLIAADATDIPEVRQVVELRAVAAKSSTAKLHRMLDCMSPEDDRARGLLFYHGTIGGRWSGRLIQPQNLYQVDAEEDGDDIKHTIDIVLAAIEPDSVYQSIDTIVGPPMVAVAKCMRSMFIPDTDKRFIGGDKSNIEGRINAWLSGERWKLDAFRAYDAGSGPDLYRLAYSRSFGVPVSSVRGPSRQVGKVQELALGFQGSVGAIIKMAKNKNIPLKPLLLAVQGATSIDLWDEIAAKFKSHPRKHGLGIEMWTAMSIVVKGFREANANIMQGWWDLQDAAIEAVKMRGQVVDVFKGRIRYMFARGFLWCSLPSKRLIAYCNPSVKVTDESYWLVPNENGDGGVTQVPADKVAPWEEAALKAWGGKLVKREKRQVWYEGYDGETRRWSVFPLYGGMQCAHVVSAIARDCLVEDMLIAEARGYEIVLSVHDEILTEQDYGVGTPEELQEIMCIQPWFIDDQDLPLAAKCWTGVRYDK